MIEKSSWIGLKPIHLLIMLDNKPTMCNNGRTRADQFSDDNSTWQPGTERSAVTGLDDWQVIRSLRGVPLRSRLPWAGGVIRKLIGPGNPVQ